jgi:hypothetical protein
MLRAPVIAGLRKRRIEMQSHPKFSTLTAVDETMLHALRFFETAQYEFVS